MVGSLVHKNPKASDADLAKEAAAYLANAPPLQVMVELLEKLRALNVPWWSPKMLHDKIQTIERMTKLEKRPDLRQRITMALTGYPAKAAYRMPPEKQADLIDDVIKSGDRTEEEFELAFNVSEIVIYGDVPKLWELFRSQMPWDEDKPEHRDIVRSYIESCMNDKRGGKPFLTNLDVLESIDGNVWYAKIPRDLHIQVDRARFKQERGSSAPKAFSAKQVMEIISLETILKHLPPDDLIEVVKLGAKNMGFSLTAAPEDPLDGLEIKPLGEADSPKAHEAPVTTKVGTTGAAPATTVGETSVHESPTMPPAAHAEPDGPASPKATAVPDKPVDGSEDALIEVVDGPEIVVVSEQEASLLPMEKREASSPDILKDIAGEISLIDKLEKELSEYGLKFTERRFDERALYRVRKIVIDGAWPSGDEKDLRSALMLTLKGFDPKLDPEIDKQATFMLKSLVMAELGRHEKTAPSSAKLGNKSSKPTGPPPIPAAKK